MLEHLHSSGELTRILPRLHRQLALDDPGAAVELVGHEMHRRAMLLVVSIEGPLMGMEARILRQERGMNVEDPSGKEGQELRGQYTHEAGEHDQGRRVFLYDPGELGIVGDPVGGGDATAGCGQGARRYAEGRRSGETRGLWLVGDDGRNAIAHVRIAAPLDECPHVGSASRNEDGDGQSIVQGAQAITTPRVPERTSPITSAG